MKIAQIKKAGFIISFLGLIILFIFTLVPSPIQNKSITFTPISGENKYKTPYDLPPYLSRKHLLTLSYPKWVWVGDSQSVILNIQPEESSPTGIVGLPLKYSTSLEARLDLNSMEMYPGKIMFQLLQSDKPAQFLWKVTAENGSVSSGKLWLSIVIHQSDESLKWTIPIFALPIEMNIKSWLGWSLPIIRGLIMTGLVFMIVLWILLTTPGVKK